MGWGGKGGKGKHWGPGPGVVAAEIAGAAIVGGLAGAAVASAVRPHPKHYPKHHYHPPPAEVIVVGGGCAPVVVVEARPKPKPKPKPVVVVSVGGPCAPVVVVAAKPAPYWKGKGKGKWKGKGKGKGYAPVVVVEQTFPAIASVSVPAFQDETRGDTHFFAVDVLPEGGGGPWRVMRRYNEFHDLYDKFGHQTFPDAPFPGKHLLGIGLKMEERRRGLEVWLQRIVAHPSSRGPWARPLNDFATAGRQYLSTPAVAVAVPIASPSAPVYAAASAPPAPAVASAPPAAPAPAPSAPPAEEEAEYEDDGSVMAIEIPAGVTAGAVLGITVMDGSQVNFTVPEGTKAGDTVELWYDAATGTLNPI